MAVGPGLGEGVKASLKGGTASTSTVNTLQQLLELGQPAATQEASSVRSAQTTSKLARNASGKPARGAIRKANQAQTATIHEDAQSQLSPREKYALATETVNAALKVLSESLKSATNTTTDAIISPNKSASNVVSQRALKARSANITPSKPNANVQKPLARLSSSSPSVSGPSQINAHIAATAECAHLAFSFLRSADPTKFGAREMPALQLENGMLALAGRMIAHSLESMALKELRIVKRRLEASFPTLKPPKARKAPSTSQMASEKETLASLMQLDIDLHTNSEAQAVAITYYFHVLKIISATRKPAVIEGVLQYLQIDTRNSVVDLILRQIEQSGDNDKWIKQLESLSQTLLALCPSISTSVDVTATDPALSPTPQTVFDLQVLALQIRKLWWRFSNHEANVSKELVEPLHKCATAFSRRSASTQDHAATYECLDRCIASLGPYDRTSAAEALFNIHCLLQEQAEAASLPAEARKWMDEMVLDCAPLEDNHVRRVLCAVKTLDPTLRKKPFTQDLNSVNTVSDLLCSKLTGNAADYDLLMSSLSKLARTLHNHEFRFEMPFIVRLSEIIAGFVLRYSRSYPGKNTTAIQSVLDTALRLSGSVDDMLVWLTEDAAKFFINQGALKAVAQAAATMPLSLAWTGSVAVVSLGRVLHALSIRAVRRSETISTLFFDLENLSSAERGTLLEMQLKYFVDLAAKPKYFDALQKALPELLNRLSKLYTDAEYPIRRSRVACLALKLPEHNTRLLSDDHLRPWKDTNLDSETNLGKDVGLSGLLVDVKATLHVARSFSDGQTSVKDLKPSLREWEKVIDGLQDCDHGHSRLEDPKLLVRQLSTIVEYLNALGDETTCLAVQLLIFRLNRVIEDRDSQLCFTTTDLARQYLQLGYSRRAEMILSEVQTALGQQETSVLVKLNFQVAHAEYFLAIDNLDECRSALEEAHRLRSHLSPHDVSREDRRRYELLHAQAWSIHSKALLATGFPHESLAAAKQSVRLLNGIWSSLERSDSKPAVEPVPEIDEASLQDSKERTGVSKLQLTSKNCDQPSKLDAHRTKGASFWPLVQPLSKALLQLSDVYAHHGLFNESSYYSDRAVHIAEAVGSSELLMRIRSHRSCLLTLADRVAEAELCLTQGISSQTSQPSQNLVEYNCALAAIREHEGSLEEAAALFQIAEELLNYLGADSYLEKLERIDSDDGNLESRMASLSISATDKNPSGKPKAGEDAARGKLKASVKKSGSRTTKSSREPKRVSTSKGDAKVLEKPDYLFEKARVDVALRRALLDIKRGKDVQTTLDQMPDGVTATAVTLQKRLLVHNELMRRAMAALETDVTLNVLPESTLSFPATRYANNARCTVVSKESRAAKKTTTKTARKKDTCEKNFGDLLCAARESLLQDRWRSDLLCGTIQTHLEGSKLLNATLLLSFVSDVENSKAARALNETLAIDWPRIKASQYEQGAMIVDEQASASELLTWPCYNSEPRATPALTAEEFQGTFVDILPRSWTTVSLCLNEDGSELYVARYRSGQTPFIIRLPFCRNDSDELTEQPFDYHKGKAELLDIIGQSDTLCHNPGPLDIKGTKQKWWDRREDLDKQLQELLINIENIWFGGFKSVFAQHRTEADHFATFRTSFEAVLKLHLPSRKAAKDYSNGVSLHDHVLELFIGLGDDKGESVDLDEPLADLLYFVVDLLQFNGERNAYDEIDIDNMTVDVLDALRAYHAACATAIDDAQHLILVLDRRLQNFPWESLPCLEEANVSRVGSLQSLRQKVMAQQRSCSGVSIASAASDPSVKKSAGTYILNPGSDLRGTQTILDPVLSKLDNWSAIVNKEPDEVQFSSALTDSSMLLYFGHGAGSQYIRPRTIKKLERCCDVVWLMGCSSGTVNEYGAFEPCATPLSYLLAGERTDTASDDDPGTCKAVVATLWDVTDKDIDRFSIALGEEWGLWDAQERPLLPTKTPRKRELLAAAPSTPQQIPKTPKKPRVVKTPAASKTPMRDRTRPARTGSGKQSLVEAVSRSRSACHFRYLNGAAPVVYGIPVYLGD